MSFKIGFNAETNEKKAEEKEILQARTSARSSLVKVYFEERNAAYSYYNDSFDLKVGDYVWVEGKLYGIRGIVTEVVYSFKIKLSDYKRVIGVADTGVVGELKFVGNYFVSLDGSMPFSQIRTWFLPPESDTEFVNGSDDSTFLISDLSSQDFPDETVNGGCDYFFSNKVAYIGIKNGRGCAIVEGRKPYTVEFDYRNGEVGNIVCDCFETGICKHSFAALLCLKNILNSIEKNYQSFDGELSAVRKTDLFRFAINSEKLGSIRIG